jgi:hypothetical protein
MTHLKAIIIIGLLSCFIPTNTHAQAGVNIDSVRKALLVSQQNYKANILNKKPFSYIFTTNAFREKVEFTNTTIDLELPKYYNKSGWFKIVPEFFDDPIYSSTVAIDRHNQNVILQNKSMNFDFRNNAINAILSRDATVFERVVGTTLLLFGN